MQAYLDELDETTEELQIVKNHMSLRDQMAATSHMFRRFLLYALLIVCCSQATVLYSMIAVKSSLSLYQAYHLIVSRKSVSQALLSGFQNHTQHISTIPQASSVVQITGVGLCLHGAAQITHRTQRITSAVSQWHAIASCSHHKPPVVQSQPASPRTIESIQSLSSSSSKFRKDTSLRTSQAITHGQGQEKSRFWKEGQRRHSGCVHMLSRASSALATVVDVAAIEHDPRNFQANSFNKRQAIGEYYK